MLVYLDTAQLALLERATAVEREHFIAGWQEIGCELAVSLQILQEARKRGTAEDVSKRLTTMLSLGPLRGIPAGSAGVVVREVTFQVMRLLGNPPADPIALGRGELFPPLSSSKLMETMSESGRDLHHFNLVGEARAGLQVESLTLPTLKKGAQVDPVVFERDVRAMLQRQLEDLPPGVTAIMARSMAEGVIDAVTASGGDLWEANLRRLGIADLKCLGDVNPEDYPKTAVFLEAGREWPDDIADQAGVGSEKVLEVLNDLRPYDAPGFSVEMAVFRARGRHSSSPTAADQVDEEHVSFAPYVDVLFADKRTVSYVREEERRRDGRISCTASNIVRGSTLDEVLSEIRNAVLRPVEGEGAPPSR